jgi:oxygen-independent coproporphyrinogen-3 oxidase
MMTISRADYTAHFERGVVTEFAPHWEAFADQGWIEVTDDEIRLVGLGVFYTGQVQRLLCARRVKELDDRRVLVGYQTPNLLRIASADPR